MLSRIGPRRAALALGLVAAAAAITPAHAERVVAIAPLSTLGAEDTSANTRKLIGQIEAAIAALADTRVVTAAQVADAIKKSKKPQLKVCEGDAACLAELGRLVGAQVVIAGEVGGLGDAKVIYLGATDVAAARELRSTTLAVGGQADAEGGPSGAVIRLLDPDRYRGALRFAIDVAGATIFVDGARVTPSPRGEVGLAVGTHAVRVTHPAYRDYVRFHDVGYGKTSDVAVGLQQYPIVERDVQGKPVDRDRVITTQPAWWRRWYVAGPAAVGLGIAAGFLVNRLVHRLPDGPCRDVTRDGGGC